MTKNAITDTRKVWLVYNNTDDIEGRGQEYISHVCELEATAMRIGKAAYTMGADCPIERAVSYRINGQWVQPSPVLPPSDEDKRVQGRIDTERSVSGLAEKAIQAAEDLGLAPEHLKALKDAI